MSSTIKRIAVVGAGIIGASWAAYFLAHGFDVAVTDPAPQGAAFVQRFVEDVWPDLEKLGLAEGASISRMQFFSELEQAIAGADFVQESGPERIAHKQELYARMDALLPEHVLIASSSSGLIMSEIQRDCRHPQRCLIGHPFNPPHLLPLVEVVGGEKTGVAQLEQAMAFYRAIGKHAIHIRKEVTGHVANRLQAAVWREAAHLAAEGVASIADIDAAVSYGPGLRWALMGPSLTFHLAGGEGGMQHFLDHLGGPVQDWWDALGAPRLDDKLKQVILDGVLAEAGNTALPAMAQERNQLLLELLAVIGKKQNLP